jgi:hypothetical protein
VWAKLPPDITKRNRIDMVLLGMHNKTFGSCVMAIDRNPVPSSAVFSQVGDAHWLSEHVIDRDPVLWGAVFCQVGGAHWLSEHVPLTSGGVEEGREGREKAEGLVHVEVTYDVMASGR